VVTAKISRPSLNPQGQASTLRAKPQSSGLRAWTVEAKAFKHMVIAEINMCSTSDSLYVDRG